MKVAINGLGRIGRVFFRIALERGINIVAINDLVDTATLVYFLKYDSIYGNYKETIEYGKDFIKIKNKKIKVFAEKEPENLPWKELDAQSRKLSSMPCHSIAQTMLSRHH